MKYNQPQKSTPAVLPEQSGADCLKEMRVSVGNITSGKIPQAKTSGVKIRGTGAAVKGTMARGPMA
jgi:hypothetical protein